MKRKAYGRDFGLSSRMFLTMFTLGLLYVVFFVVLLNILNVGIFAVILIIGVLAFVQYYTSDKVALMASGAKVVELSHGNQQRVQLAAALMHDPELLVLDEPFAGLDPGGVDDMTEILAERARAGVTVLFSSHQLDLVEHICEAVAIIHRGRVVAQGAVSALERGDRLRLAVRVAGDPGGDWARQLDPGIASVERVDAGLVLLVLAPDADSQKVLDTARAAGPVEHFSFASRRLSEVFRDVTGEDA